MDFGEKHCMYFERKHSKYKVTSQKGHSIEARQLVLQLYCRVHTCKFTDSGSLKDGSCGSCACSSIRDTLELFKIVQYTLSVLSVYE